MRAVTIRTAVILAAGRGIRLGPLGRRICKGCIQVEPNGPTIVAESIAKLRSRGIERIVIVTGHLREQYEVLVAGPLNGIATTVHNPRFAHSGSMDSLACASPVVDNDFLLLESDLVYEARALDAALDSHHADVVVVSGATNSGDEVYVDSSDGIISGITKDRTRVRSSAGELVGISKISTALYERMLAYASEHPNNEYESGALTSVAQSYPVYFALIPDLVWAEIDTPAHLDRVRRTIYPMLQQRESVSASDRAAG